ncbi:hypothetical protein AHF37_10255 [Paragonimus kellicotti]|nr:hypothetical protein AHF37_10255 [Paragonimus kellicotti]
MYHSASRLMPFHCINHSYSIVFSLVVFICDFSVFVSQVILVCTKSLTADSLGRWSCCVTVGQIPISPTRMSEVAVLRQNCG